MSKETNYTRESADILKQIELDCARLMSLEHGVGLKDSSALVTSELRKCCHLFDHLEYVCHSFCQNMFV